MFDTVHGPGSSLADPPALAGLPSGRLAEVIAATHRMESVLIAHRLAAIAVLLARYDGMSPSAIGQHPEMVAGYERTCAEVSALLNVPPTTAGQMVHAAEVLDERLPKIAALFAQGRIDWRAVQIIIYRTDLVDQDLIEGIDERLAARVQKWSGWSRQRIINAVDAAVLAVDPDAARQRRKESDRDRYIWVSPDCDGVARVEGRLAAPAAVAFDRRLSELAQSVCGSDPRTMAQRRADALAALTEGRSLACGCERDDCPSRSEARSGGVGSRVILNIVTTDATVTGDSDRPGYLEGFGVIDAEEVRRLADTASQRLVDATADAAAALRYRPSVALARAVRCRDLTCRFPGCHRRATHCDLDHTIPFNHADPSAGGLTVASNIKCLCRFHHRLKTAGGWRDQQLSDGTVVWTSPSGKEFRTRPGGVDIIAELADALGATDQRPLPRRSVGHAARRVARVARIRRDNPARREANRIYEARRAEIRYRKERNEMRAILFLFKVGERSTSPFCSWINDPPEPEELPPDWQPPPLPPEPDEPPF